jgi:hypothetical protein
MPTIVTDSMNYKIILDNDKSVRQSRTVRTYPSCSSIATIVIIDEQEGDVHE